MVKYSHCDRGGTAYTTDLKSVGETLRVQIPPVAPKKEPINSSVFGSFLFPKTHFVTHLEVKRSELRICVQELQLQKSAKVRAFFVITHREFAGANPLFGFKSLRSHQCELAYRISMSYKPIRFFCAITSKHFTLSYPAALLTATPLRVWICTF